MNNIMDFWRNEWNAVADTSEVTGIDDVELFSGSIIEELDDSWKTLFDLAKEIR